jgi:uncharacterized membrane protein
MTVETKTQLNDLARTLGFLITFAGVFFLIASSFSLLTLLVLQAAGDSGSMSADEKYALLLTISSVLISIAAFIIGIKLIKQQDIGRKLFNGFTVIVIALAWVKYTYKTNEIAKSYANIPAELAAQAKGIELGDALTVFILPFILIVVVLLLNFRSRIKSQVH